MKKYLLFAIMAVVLGACNNNAPTSKYVGIWEPATNLVYDKFIISADSIKAVQSGTGLEHFQAHYKILRDGVAELERCWLEDMAKNHDLSQGDWNPEQYFFDEVQMYIPDYLSQKVPNYSRLKLKRYE